jgi:hypothetical protein
MPKQSRRGCDFAWGVKPGTERHLARALKRHGFHFVVRYLGRDPSKNITHAEVRAYKAEGLDIVTVYEDAATWMLGGAQAGTDAARLARDQLHAAGAPDHAPVYFADDFAVTAQQLPALDACLNATAFVLSDQENGIYGPLAAVSKAEHVRYRWQTVAWSGGVWAPDDDIRQYAISGMTMGVQWDVDVSYGQDFGQWQWPGPAPHRKEKKVATVIKSTRRKLHHLIQSEPVLTSGGLAGVLGPAVAFLAKHAGLHLTTTQVHATLTIIVALTSAYAAARTTKPSVTLITGALATAATAATAFGLHMPPHLLGAEMPIAAMIVSLLVRSHVSPKSGGTVPTVGADVAKLVGWYDQGSPPAPPPPAAPAPVTVTSTAAPPQNVTAGPPPGVPVA